MGSVMLLEMATEMAIAKVLERVIALAAKGVQPHRAAELAALMPKARVPMVAVRGIVAAVREIAAAIAVPDQRHEVMHPVATVARNSVARGAKFLCTKNLYLIRNG